ncbi:hypothetical protein [Rhodopseudomonas sp. B29]|uniref:hypothetical protein n=1 Tax=Rhodopseudomonas sp. B29 TaxID=95607 RepID=UPI00034A5366|nr:hypothetical protein [Rhodopseudomonas sp. B29]
MTADRSTFTVQHKRRRTPDANYASKPGDARRSGRSVAAAGAPVIRIEYRNGAAAIEARLGVIVVGTVTHDPATGGYFWAVFLPDARRTPTPATTEEKARAALDHRIKQWCEAARLITARRP